jgi:small glutamine-rich tetratricopeptide repeat-containing protein alpha
LKTGAQNAEARIGVDQDTPDATTTPGAAPSSGMADMLRNMGGAGGMPDIASLMNNPMMMQMAQQMMANGGLDNLMQNPSVANMVRYPSLGEIIADM